MRFLESESPSTDESGQYMVEFALSFVVFVLFILFVIDLGLLIYNHNLFYHGMANAAREASIGASNQEIRRAADDFIVDDYFPTALMIARPDSGLVIEPQRRIHRVFGREVTVRMPTTFGFSLLGFASATISVPVRSSELITVRNDEDRDGCVDALEGPGVSCDGYRNFASTSANDHRNTGLVDQIYFNGGKNDADDDGANLRQDRVRIAYFQNAPAIGGANYAINRPNDAPISPPGDPTFNWNGRTWETWFDGRYHAPVVWDDGTESVPQAFPKTLPRGHVDDSSETVTVRTLQAEYDRDNDGWEDKYDDFPNDPLRN